MVTNNRSLSTDKEIAKLVYDLLCSGLVELKKGYIHNHLIRTDCEKPSKGFNGSLKCGSLSIPGTPSNSPRVFMNFRAQAKRFVPEFFKEPEPEVEITEDPVSEEQPTKDDQMNDEIQKMLQDLEVRQTAERVALMEQIEAKLATSMNQRYSTWLSIREDELRSFNAVASDYKEAKDLLKQTSMKLREVVREIRSSRKEDYVELRRHHRGNLMPVLPKPVLALVENKQVESSVNRQKRMVEVQDAQAGFNPAFKESIRTGNYIADHRNDPKAKVKLLQFIGAKKLSSEKNLDRKSLPELVKIAQNGV